MEVSKSCPMAFVVDKPAKAEMNGLRLHMIRVYILKPEAEKTGLVAYFHSASFAPAAEPIFFLTALIEDKNVRLRSRCFRPYFR